MTQISKIINPDSARQLHEEWIVANGLGGFASSSISGAPMRKYHALLIAALPAPFGRTVMLNYVGESIKLPDKREIPLSLLRKKTYHRRALKYS